MERLNELKVKFDRVKTITIASSIIDLIAAIFLIVSSFSLETNKTKLNELLYVIVIIISSLVLFLSIILLVKTSSQIKLEEVKIQEEQKMELELEVSEEK